MRGPGTAPAFPEIIEVTMSIMSTKERPSALQQGRLTVPWRTVVTLAVALAYADGYWLTSLRGAVGAIERTQSPFASWLRESTLVLPVFVLAVLGALTLSMRWFGPVLRRHRTVAAAALLVVAAGTIVGLAAIVASSAYDYHLQVAQLQMMDAMRTCTGNCLTQEIHATLAVHVRAVIYISGWLLLTNLVLVSWLVAMMGGRLTVSTTRHLHDAPTETASLPGGSRVHDIRFLLVGTLVGSAAIHAALVPGYLSEWGGVLLLVAAVWELAVAGMLLARLQERTLLLAAAVISIAPLVLWLFTRAGGLPESLASSLEVATLLAAVVLLRTTGSLELRAPASAHVRGLILVALIAVTAIGIAATGLSWFDAFGISGTQTVMNMPH
jgi:hypothetical protein